MEEIKKAINDVVDSLAMNETKEEELEAYEVPAYQSGDDVVDTEVVEPKEEEADFTSAIEE